MIQRLQHSDVNVAQKIRKIFQVSYAVEADLLRANDFPPLKRSVAKFLKSRTDFYGYFLNDELVAVIEVKSDAAHTHIQSLVVDPYLFRQGIGEKLLHFILEACNSSTYSVETGIANLPAISLYKKFEFLEVKQWDTNHGVRKIRFKKRI